MANFSRIEVAQVILNTGMVPLFYHPDVEVCKKVLKACYAGGARLMEYTARGDFAYEVYAELQKFVSAHLPGMIMGVGSVSDGPAASMFMQMGANFIVTPAIREDIAIVCNRRKVMYLPGCGSLSEIGRAEELGCEIIKLFPGSLYGPAFVKAVLGPQPWTLIMPTGGVTTEEANLKQWFEAGVASVGLGSQLISKDLLENGRYDELEITVKNTMDLIQRLKK